MGKARVATTGKGRPGRKPEPNPLENSVPGAREWLGLRHYEKLRQEAAKISTPLPAAWVRLSKRRGNEEADLLVECGSAAVFHFDRVAGLDSLRGELLNARAPGRVHRDGTLEGRGILRLLEDTRRALSRAVAGISTIGQHDPDPSAPGSWSMEAKRLGDLGFELLLAREAFTKLLFAASEPNFNAAIPTNIRGDPDWQVFLRYLLFAETLRKLSPIKTADVLDVAALVGLETATASQLGSVKKKWDVRLSRVREQGPISRDWNPWTHRTIQPTTG